MRLTSAITTLILAASATLGGGRPGAGTGDPVAGADPTDCARCHRQIAGEWREQAHARAFTDPLYQAALATTRNPERCFGCHAPEPVHRRLGRMPDARTEDREQGVHCESCHRVGERIAGPFGAETDAHTSVRHPSFSPQGSISVCESCHDSTIGPVHALARDFRAAGLARRGKSCVGCHMPRVLRPIANDPDSGSAAGPDREGRSHELLGPDDAEFCAEAFKIAVTVDGPALELAVGNRAGHRIPGLELRRFPILVRQFDAQGRVLAEHRVEFSTENPLYARETRRFRFGLAPDAASAETVLEHEFDRVRVAELSREAHSW